MEYNTRQKKLPLPEYGRSVQKMVDHALTIEDREERQRCAASIVRIMGSMFPNTRNLPDYERKLWDHLAIMSDFMLDIDYPFEVIKKEEFHVAPERVPYQNGEIKNRHYGRIVEQMIAHACTLEEGEERDRLIELILVQMKKNYIAWNKDGVEDKKILEDLRVYTKGAIDLQEREIRISQGSNAQRYAGNAKRNNNGKKNFKRKF
ncbi:MAG: DUF4290 domain-containing protein [Bacteroidaceae bacterium]|nr:DUF4290 domain-containing protein [Bacteroidaceae bacterium]MBR3906522.1 DUF4290 domain-containing protein [Bacteroidaceae bacterium]